VAGDGGDGGGNGTSADGTGAVGIDSDGNVSGVEGIGNAANATGANSSSGFSGPFSGRTNLSREELSRELDLGLNTHPEVNSKDFGAIVDLSFQNSVTNPTAATAMEAAKAMVTGFMGMPMTVVGLFGKAANVATGRSTTPTGIAAVDSAITGAIGGTVGTEGAQGNAVADVGSHGSASEGVANDGSAGSAGQGQPNAPAAARSGGLMSLEDLDYLKNRDGLAPADRFTPEWYSSNG